MHVVGHLDQHSKDVISFLVFVCHCVLEVRVIALLFSGVAVVWHYFTICCI